MTFEEAKKILEKEFAVINLHKSTEPFEFDDSNWFGYEKPSVLEAFRVLSKEGYYITISGHDYDMRKKRLEKEYEKNTKAPGSAENLIKEDSGVNPALAESASQFNDALLDKQAKKIAELTKENERLERVSKTTTDEFNKLYYRMITKSDKIKALDKEIAKLNGIIHKKNLKIEELGKESSRHLEGKMKMFGENFDLEQKLKDKDAVLADVAEELRLSKIREKNLTEVSQKYIKENEELKKELDVAKKQNTAVMVDMTAKCFRAARESINDVFESYAAKYAKSSLDDLKEKAYELFNAKEHNLGLVGSKDGNGIFDQMVGADIAEKGEDHSGVTVLCGKDFIDAIKKMK